MEGEGGIYAGGGIDVAVLARERGEGGWYGGSLFETFGCALPGLEISEVPLMLRNRKLSDRLRVILRTGGISLSQFVMLSEGE